MGQLPWGGDVRDVYVTLCQGSLPMSHPPLSAPTCGVAVAWRAAAVSGGEGMCLPTEGAVWSVCGFDVMDRFLRP